MPEAIVVDANLFKYWYEHRNGRPNAYCTEDATRLFDEGQPRMICFDVGGQIAKEWEQTVPCEYFEVWYAKQLQLGTAVLVKVRRDEALKGALVDCGFPLPPASKDIWYVWTALGAMALYKLSTMQLVSEDIDFFDPTKKDADQATKLALKRSCGGPVARVLYKKGGVQVVCLCRFLGN